MRSAPSSSAMVKTTASARMLAFTAITGAGAMAAVTTAASHADAQPPAALTPNPTPTPTQESKAKEAAEAKKLKEAEEAKAKKDAKQEIDPKKKHLWLDAEGGISHANLSTFTANIDEAFAGFVPQSGIGSMLGVAIGLRIVFLTLGVRGRVASYLNGDPNQPLDDWRMSSLNGELGFRVPLRRFEPMMTLSAGYTTFGGLDNAVRGIGDGMNANGFNARLGMGFDYFLSRYLSFGLLGSFELLALTRRGIPVRDVANLMGTNSLEEGAVRFLQARGSTYGLAIALTSGLKVHF